VSHAFEAADQHVPLQPKVPDITQNPDDAVREMLEQDGSEYLGAPQLIGLSPVLLLSTCPEEVVPGEIQWK